MPFWVHWLPAAEADTLEVGPNGGFAEIWRAVEEADDGDRIEVQPGVYEGPVRLGGKVLEIVSTEGPEVTTLLAWSYDGVYYQPAIEVFGSSPVTIAGFTIDGVGETLGMIVGNRAEVFAEDLILVGGPDRNLVINESTFTMVDSVFAGTVGVNGGHLQVYESLVDFDGVMFSKGHSGFGGGVAYLTGANAVFRNCTFADNEASEGGAFRIESEAADSVTFEDCVFERNEALFGNGGAVIQFGGNLTFLRTELRDNIASSGNGAIDHRYGTQFRFEDGVVSGGVAPYVGGIGLYDGSEAVILRSTFEANTSGADGGAIALFGNAEHIEIGGNRFCGNTAVGDGGALFLASYQTLTADIHHNVFVGNEAGSAGSAVGLVSTLGHVSQNTFVDSVSSEDLGALWVGYQGSADLVNNTFVASEGAAAVKDPDAGALEAAYTLFHGNDRDLVGTASSDTTVEAEPGFVSHVAGDCGSDVHPAPGSALIDAGDPALLDDDGTRSDIGAYGGPGASTLVDVDGDGLIVGDCAPFDPVASAPGAEVAGDGLDQDCDGQDLCYVDGDDDGTGSEATATGPIGCEDPGLTNLTGDCDDADASVALDCDGPDGPAGDDDDDAPAGSLPPLWFCATSPGAPSWPVLAWVAGWFVLRRVRRQGA